MNINKTAVRKLLKKKKALNLNRSQKYGDVPLSSFPVGGCFAYRDISRGPWPLHGCRGLPLS